jgi:hypothetical protein
VAAVNVSGTATDPLGTGGFRHASGVTLVEVRLNEGAWLPATGTGAWSRALTLTDGPNRIEARARDAVGNYSALAATAVTFGTAATPSILVTAMRLVAGEAQVIFSSALGTSYQLEWAPTLAPPISWTPLPAGLVPGTGAAMTFTDPTAVGQPQRFYRLKMVKY